MIILLFLVHLATYVYALNDTGTQKSPTPTPYYRSEVHINCGGKSDEWYQSDNLSERPLWLKLLGNYSFSSGDLANYISGTDPKDSYALRSNRGGKNRMPFGYKLSGLENGMYECKLYFAEKNPKYFHDGSRVMTATINGLSKGDIDVHKEATGNYKALTKIFEFVRVKNNYLDVWIKPKKGDGFLSAISCEKYKWNAKSRTKILSENKLSEVHVNCGGDERTGKFIPDSMWARPNYLLVWGSYHASRSGLVMEQGFMQQTDINKICKSERFADNGSPFGYTISNVRAGSYECVLHFEDTEHFKSFIGKNVFTVAINGVKSHDIDVFKLAGGTFIPWTTTLRNIRVDENGGSSINVRIDSLSGNGFISGISCTSSV